MGSGTDALEEVLKVEGRREKSSSLEDVALREPGVCLVQVTVERFREDRSTDSG